MPLMWTESLPLEKYHDSWCVTPLWSNFGLFIFECFSEYHIPRNISWFVSPIGSPQVHPTSPDHLHGVMSPISSPQATSGSSIPLIGGSGEIQLFGSRQSTFMQEGFGVVSKSSHGAFHNGACYHDPKPKRSWRHSIWTPCMDSTLWIGKWNSLKAGRKTVKRISVMDKQCGLIGYANSSYGSMSSLTTPWSSVPSQLCLTGPMTTTFITKGHQMHGH